MAKSEHQSALICQIISIYLLFTLIITHLWKALLDNNCKISSKPDFFRFHVVVIITTHYKCFVFLPHISGNKNDARLSPYLPNPGAWPGAYNRRIYRPKKTSGASGRRHCRRTRSSASGCIFRISGTLEYETSYCSSFTKEPKLLRDSACFMAPSVACWSNCSAEG